MNIETRKSIGSTYCLGKLSSTMLTACALMLGVQRSGAQFFPVAAADEPAFSIGVFQLTVDPAFAFLFAPNGSSYYYPGYSPGSGVLTSPTMYDFNDTYIGVSASHTRNTGSPTYFTSPDASGVRVGTSGLYPPFYPDFIPSYSSYSFLPPDFVNAPNGIHEIMTEIESFNLTTTIGSAGLQCTNSSDPRVPHVPPTPISMVVAGPHYINGLPQNRRSIGMVQQLSPTTAGTDFPAESFFNIFVQVTLPVSSGNNAGFDFPGDPGIPLPPGQTQAGAVLYNDANNPLVIVNTNVTTLPPTAVYIHGQTVAVPMKFQYANPPYWAADDVIGYLVLAGHGVVPTNPSNCVQVAAAQTTVLDQTLGPVGSPMPRMPIPWLRTSSSFPTGNSTYESTVNTVVSAQTGTSVLDDTVKFAVSGLGTLYVRDLVINGLSGVISPPVGAGNATTYSASTATLTCQVSTDGVNFTTASSVSPGQVQMEITNSGTSGSTTIYNTELDLLNIQLNTSLGAIYIRESPSKQSLGRHTIAPDPRGFRVSSFFDCFLDVSLDNSIWYPAGSSTRLQPGVPPMMPGSIFISKVSPTNVVLNWQNQLFTLQTSTNVLGPYTDITGFLGGITNAPYTNAITNTQQFFRLRQ